MANTHKAQHYLPKSYLERWVDPERQELESPFIWIFSKDGGTSFRRGPKKAFKRTDLYTTLTDEGVRDLRLEKMLGDIESRTADVYAKKLTQHGELTIKEKVFLCAFVAVADFRTLASRDFQKGQWSELNAMMDKIAKSMRGAPPEKRAAAASVLRGDPKGSLTHEQVKELSQKPLQKLLPSALRVWTPILAQMDLAILCSDDEIGFITSDRPCVWNDPVNAFLPPIQRRQDLRSETMQLFMPISPNQCLYFNWHGLEGYRSTPAAALDEINLMHRSNCNSQYIVRKNCNLRNWFK